MDALTVYRVVTRRIGVVAVSAVLTCAAALLGYRLLPVHYQASVLMLPSDRAMRQPVTMDAAAQVDTEQRAEQVATLVEMAGSRAVCAAAIRTLHIPMLPASLQRKVKVERVSDKQTGRQTNLLRVTVMSPTPDMAVKTANAVAESFRGLYNDVSHREAVDNRKFLDDQLILARNKLYDSELKLRRFRGERKVVNMTAQEDSAVQGLASLRADRDLAAAQLAETTGRLATVSGQLARTPKSKRTVQMTSDGSAAALLQTQIADMEKELAMLRSRYTPKHPKVISLESTLERARTELAGIRSSMVGKQAVGANPGYASLLDEKQKLDAERTALQSKLATLDASIKKREAELTSYPGTDVELERRVLDFRTAQESYSAVLARLNQARMSESLTTETGAIQVIDPATRAEGPFRRAPNLIQTLIASLILGAALGVGFCLATESMDRSIRTPKDARALMGLPVMGVIPAVETDASDTEIARMTLLQPLSSYAEAFRFLATDLLLTAEGTDIKTIMVVTPAPQQGGTAVTTNLGITLAQAGKQVTLLDGNLRWPKLHRVFDTDNSEGLTELLANDMPFSAGIRESCVENLRVIPSGSIRDNPWTMIRSPRFARLVGELRKASSFVLIDSPSAAVFADAITMSSVVDGVIVVIRANEAPGGNELQLIDLLKKARVNILGLVLNGTSPSSSDGYHFHDRYSPPAEVGDSLPTSPNAGGRSGDTQSTGRLTSDEG